MNRLVKLISVLIISIMIFSTSCVVFADSENISEVKPEATPVEQEEISLTQKIINIDNDTVNLQLTIETNDEKVIDSDTEILFLIDDSTSMGQVLEDNATTRKVKVINSTKQLIKKISSNNSNVKMGIMLFSSGAELMQDFTEKSSNLISNCDQIIQTSPGGSTNMAYALSHAKETFSINSKNKIIILLTDGEPTDGDEATRTQLQDNDIYIISTLVGLKNQNEEKITNIFGTQSNPVADRFYNIDDSGIETTIGNSVYNTIANNFQNAITNILAENVLENEILENFDIELLSTSLGTAKLMNDKIVWNIDKIEGKKVAKLDYALKLKENHDSSITNRILDTNKPIQLSFNNKMGLNEKLKANNNPQIKLTDLETISEENNDDNEEISVEKETSTVSKKNLSSDSLPYTGKRTAFIFVGIIVAIITACQARKKLKSL